MSDRSRMVQLYVSEVEILKRQAMRWEALVEWLGDSTNSYSGPEAVVTVLSVTRDLVMLHGAKGHIHGKNLAEVADKLTSREPCLSPEDEARLAELEKDPPQDPRIMGWHVATTMDQRQKLQIVKQKAWADYEEYQELKAKRAGCQAVEDYRQEQDEQAQDF